MTAHAESSARPNRRRGVLLDIDGTLYLEERPIAGAIEAVEQLRARGFQLRFITNTSACLPDALADKLRSMGFTVSAGEVFTPISAARLYLAGRSNRRCSFLVHPSIRSAFAEFVEAQGDADTVVMGDMGEGFTFAVLNAAFRRLKLGAELVVLQKNPFWFTPDGPTLDCGAFAVALEFAAGCSSVVVGKPNPHFFQLALASMNVSPESALVVGDDVTTDVVGAEAASLASVLLRTGKFTPQALETSPVRPTAVLDSIAAVPAWLLTQQRFGPA